MSEELKPSAGQRLFSAYQAHVAPSLADWDDQTPHIQARYIAAAERYDASQPHVPQTERGGGGEGRQFDFTKFRKSSLGDKLPDDVFERLTGYVRTAMRASDDPDVDAETTAECAVTMILYRAYKYLIALAPPTEPSTGQGWRPTHRHVTRGTEYEALGKGTIQTNEALHDDDRVIVYRGQDGRLFARELREFNDGRFEPLPAAPSQPLPGETE